MCHMIADTQEELLGMVDKLGLKRNWIEDKGTYREHFNICQEKKQLAIRMGAKSINMRELFSITEAKKCSNTPQQ